MDDLEKQRMKKLRDELIKTALDLVALEGGAAVCVQVPNTSPPLYVVIGTPKDIKLLVD